MRTSGRVWRQLTDFLALQERHALPFANDSTMLSVGLPPSGTVWRCIYTSTELIPTSHRREEESAYVKHHRLTRCPREELDPAGSSLPRTAVGH